jgi:hypothetical protein
MDYPFLNRCAIAVVPRPPFWDWVKKTGSVQDEQIGEAKTDANIYLIPDFESEPDITDAIKKYVYQNYDEIFTSELEAWYTDPVSFPEINYDNFEKWFSISSYTMIFDTVKRPLRRE